MQIPYVDISARRAQLDAFLVGAAQMLREFGQAVTLPEDIDPKADPIAAMPHVQAFVMRTNFADATEDARIWLVNRLALFLGDYFMRRHGGRWSVECRPQGRFYGRFVIADMLAPVTPGAVLDPFGVANDVVMKGGNLLRLLDQAERELGVSGA